MKKKFLIALLTLVCALTCAFGFIACGDDDGKGTDTEQGGKKDKATVTAAEWVEIFGSADNYTIVSTMSGVDNTIKVAGNKFEINAYGAGIIYVKDGGNYYTYRHSGSQWIRMSVPESYYMVMSDSKSEWVGFFKDKMSEFTYAEGVYTAATLKFVSGAAEVNVPLNVKVKFENAELISIEYDMDMEDDEVHVSVSAVGTTTVDVPANYTERDIPST